MNIRQRKKTTTSNDSLFPKIAELTTSGFQEIIKSKIMKDDMIDFLEKKMNEESMDDYRKLLELRGDIFQGSTLSITNNQRKYLMDLALAVAFEELLDIKSIIELIVQNGVVESISIFEMMAILEYNMFFLTKSPMIPIVDQPTNKLESFNKIYIADNVIELFHSDLGKPSYKDQSNIESELAKIIGQDSIPTSIPSDFSVRALVRINGDHAVVEKSNQHIYSFLLNYNNYQKLGITYFDEIYLKKYWAITNVSLGSNETFGYYVKDGQKIYFDGIKNYSYYSMMSNTFSSNYKAARDFLVNLWKKIDERTIHY
jgi:hypothetical protein